MENILHYVWKYRLFQNNLETTNGIPVEVIDVGLQNTNEGPDFFNVKLKLNGDLWVGNVEIHQSSDDWEKHNHHSDPNYNSVILHIVEKANKEVYTKEGKKIPQCIIKYPQHIKDNYEYLIYAKTDIPCSNFISSIPSIYITSWINNLLVERLQRKTKHIETLLQRFNNSWEDVLYVLLSRNFGFGLNSDSFERLALSLPYRYIQKQSDNISHIEALLFGQAGMLEENANVDDYFRYLRQEYKFLQTKYTLIPLDAFIFKTLRSRPTAFPQIRIAQLAALFFNVKSLFAKIISCEDIGKLRLMLHVNASEYWQTHYIFGILSDKKSKYLGDASLNVILINTVVPLLFAYGKSINNESYCERSFKFLESIKPEQNSITKRFECSGIPLISAIDSQALIQLKREYCELRKCLFCRIGHRLLRSK